MKRALFILSILLFACSAFSQEKDSAQIRVMYRYKAKNFADREGRSEDLLYLDAGRNHSVFYSRRTFLLDSAKEALTARGLSPEEVFLGTKGMKQGIQERIIKNYSSGHITVFSKVLTQKYWYTDRMDSVEWDLTDDTLTVGSYFCYGAKCTFRGREWQAWYTPEIPSMDGPWKFTGLPGLILKAEDSAKEFTFESIGVVHLVPKVGIVNPLESNKSGYIETDRKTYLQIKRKSVEDIKGSITSQGMTILSVVDENGVETQIPKRVMNSIELQ
ncbi:MAG: hypothetical protein CVU10_06700 [Bacteroidetes bacterium HGW-Bacteroidetes-5]|jgi:GLPGLI family protein|nr:MAG: hypothetical protein CVU10_06700 [Bacteroidetes bacterium HGW-Bacteroidetes-5]